MPKMSDRDTRFKEAGKLLLMRLMGGDSQLRSWDEQEEIAAQSLYDFMYHVVSNTDYIALESSGDEWAIAKIPDMTAWPEISKEIERDIVEAIYWHEQAKKKQR